MRSARPAEDLDEGGYLSPTILPSGATSIDLAADRMEAMLGMKKLDIAGLRRAYTGA